MTHEQLAPFQNRSMRDHLLNVCVHGRGDLVGLVIGPDREQNANGFVGDRIRCSRGEGQVVL